VTVAFLALAGVLGGGVQSQLKSGGFDDPKSDSSQARQLLDDHFAAAPSLADLVLLVRARTGDVDSPSVAAAGQQVTRDVAAEQDMANVTSYWTTKAPDLKSKDGRSALVLAHVGGGPEKAAQRAKEVADKLAARAGPVQVQVGGRTGVVSDINSHVQSDLRLAESLAVPATLVLLVVAFGSVVAALLPLAIGLMSLTSTLLVLFVLSKVTDVSLYALNVSTAFGLGLAIDFGLLMVSRFREEREAGHDHRQAVIEAVAKAGRTILFSAATVSVAMCGLLVFPVYFLRSIAVAAMAVVVVAAVGAAVVLPALLALLGPRIDSLAVFRRRNGLASESQFWRRAAAAVMRRPIRTAVPVLIILLALGIPFLHATFAPADERALPAGSVSRQVSDALGTEFPADNAKAMTVVRACLLDLDVWVR
jgi:RND superfamily putative drug exporter